MVLATMALLVLVVFDSLRHLDDGHKTFSNDDVLTLPLSDIH